MGLSAEFLFERHIFSQVSAIGDLSHKSLEEAGLAEKIFTGLKRTHFDDIYDTLLYSRLIERAIRMNPEVKTVIDLGAGSSIPTLLAIKNTGRNEIRTFAVDIDSEAHETGSENAKFLGLSENFVFFNGPMEEGLESLGPYGPETLVVSNPPYIATPEHVRDRFFVPVNGGPQGDDYILKILNHPFPADVTIALLWGSLTSPRKIFPVMTEDFEILHTEAHRIHFGNYTTAEPLRTHLYRLREDGEVYFETTEDEGEIQYVFGTILKKK